MALAAVVQMVSSSQCENNLYSLNPIIKQAAAEGVQLIALPENFALMGHKETDKFLIAESYGNGFIQDYVSTLAKDNNIWIVAGTIPIKTKHGKVRASCLVFDHKGICVARYDKIHLFDVQFSSQEIFLESATVEPGNSIVTVDTPIGKIGLSICYDLRFPELYQALRNQGAEIFIVPAAFTAVTGKAHWEILLRARAIENLCYVLAPNQGGQHENNRLTYGHSLIIEPWGLKIAEAQDSKFIKAEIDLNRLTELRQSFPCHTHHVLRGR